MQFIGEISLGKLEDFGDAWVGTQLHIATAFEMTTNCEEKLWLTK